MSREICKWCDHIRTHMECKLNENAVMEFGDTRIYCHLTNKTIEDELTETCKDFELMDWAF